MDGDAGLQESRIVRVMRKQLVKRTLDMIRDIADRPAGDSGRSDYDTFYEVSGAPLISMGLPYNLKL
jgi:heat shock protein beta